MSLCIDIINEAVRLVGEITRAFAIVFLALTIVSAPLMILGMLFIAYFVR